MDPVYLITATVDPVNGNNDFFLADNLGMVKYKEKKRCINVKIITFNEIFYFIDFIAIN